MAGIPQLPNALMQPGIMHGAQPNNGAAPFPNLAGMMNGAPHGIQQMVGNIGDYRNALMDWQGQRPQFSYDPTLGTTAGQQHQAFIPQMMDWRQQRPSFGSFMGGPGGGNTQSGGPVMTPGGGGTGAPLQGGVGMVPGVPGSMGLNPGAAPAPTPAPPVYQFPTY
jgi:hypothetical protein